MPASLPSLSAVNPATPGQAEAEKPAAASLAATPKALGTPAAGERCRKSDNSDEPAAFTIEVGQYVAKAALAAAKRKIEKAGMVPVVEPGPKRKEMMTRIHLGQFANQQAAKKTLDKLCALNEECFFLRDKAGNFHLYAGSYHDRKAAAQEQQRFTARGIKSELKQAEVLLPTFVLTAGCFNSPEAAREKLTDLERVGMKPVLQQLY